MSADKVIGIAVRREPKSFKERKVIPSTVVRSTGMRLALDEEVLVQNIPSIRRTFYAEPSSNESPVFCFCLFPDVLLYLTPSAEDEVAVIDDKIKSALGDIKIELTKTRGEEGCGKAMQYIADIKVLVAERAVITKS